MKNPEINKRSYKRVKVRLLYNNYKRDEFYLRNVRQNNPLQRPEIGPENRNILGVLDSLGQSLLFGQTRESGLKRLNVRFGVNGGRVGLGQLGEFSGGLGIRTELADAALESFAQSRSDFVLEFKSKLILFPI